MRVLFFMSHEGHARNFEWTLRLLADRGHDLVVALDRYPERDGVQEPLRSLVAESPRTSIVAAPLERRGRLGAAGVGMRLWLDYLRYLQPEYAGATKLRERAASRTPGGRLAAKAVRPAAVRKSVRAALRAVERRVPPAPELRSFLLDQNADVVLATPLVDFGSPQVDYLRAAAAARLPTMLPVASWDNLTVKGGIHVIPDRVTVWNDVQRREAIELHGIAATKVVETGAVAYDHWFDWRPSAARDVFCARAGLASAGPFVLYLCSSRFIAPDEAEFVREWADRVRREIPGLDVLVRPHPGNPLDVARLGDLPAFPRDGSNPVDPASRADYFDSIFHSAAVVGVNTSGFLESAIAGRAVHTLLSHRHRGTQEQTLHFHYLLEENGGPLRSAKTIEEHAAQLREAVSDPAAGSRRASRFIERFVRPFGREEAASPRLVDAVEDLAGYRPPSRARVSVGSTIHDGNSSAGGLPRVL